MKIHINRVPFFLQWTLVLGILTTASASRNGSTDPLKFQPGGREKYDNIWSRPAALTQQVRKLKQEEDSKQDLETLIQSMNSFSNLFNRPPQSMSDVDGYSSEEVLKDVLLESLNSLAESDATSQRCVNDTGHIIVGLLQREKWALYFLDAAGKPGPGLSQFRFNFVGDYALCRSLVAPPGNDTAGFHGNYVTLKASFGPPDLTDPLKVAMFVQWGVCMPSTCTDQQLTTFVDEAIQFLRVNRTLYTLPAETHSNKREITTATIVAIIIICILGPLLLVGTAYDIIYVQWPTWRKEENEDGENEKDNTKSMEIQKEKKKGPPMQALLAFSLYSNGRKALATSQPPGSITCLHGLRFLSISWVVLGHLYFLIVAYAANIGTEFPKLLQRWTFDAIANALVSVDTFFTMSGILVAYLTVKEMKRTSWKLNWPMFYFHRYWRLTPPYMLALVLVVGLKQYLGEGPLWPSVQPDDKVFCEENWWTNLLYINNLVHPDRMCWGHSWYLANDMQFYVVSPLMIIPFYFNTVLGFASCSILLLVSWITTGVLSIQQQWPSTFLMAAGFRGYFDNYYIAPWCRIGPYIVGIMTGASLALKPKIVKSKFVAAVGWTVAAATALATLYGLRGDVSKENPSSVGAAALYNAVGRSAWGASVCWIVIACVSGWGGFINSILSWSPFVVLSRVTFMTYLIHMTIMRVYFQNSRTLFFITDLSMAVMFIALLCTSFAISFFFMLFLESPMIGLEKALLPKKRKS